MGEKGYMDIVVSREGCVDFTRILTSKISVGTDGGVSTWSKHSECALITLPALVGPPYAHGYRRHVPNRLRPGRQPVRGQGE
jgi:hypothetical protein